MMEERKKEKKQREKEKNVFFFIILLFICAYKDWVISPPKNVFLSGSELNVRSEEDGGIKDNAWILT
jgi:hypothetical protein